MRLTTWAPWTGIWFMTSPSVIHNVDTSKAYRPHCKNARDMRH